MCKENVTKSLKTSLIVAIVYLDKRNIKSTRWLDEKFSGANIPDEKFFILPNLNNDSEKIIIDVKAALYVLIFNNCLKLWRCEIHLSY